MAASKLTLGAREDELVVQGTTVIWYVNDRILKRQFNFDDDKEAVSQAIFTHFPSTSFSSAGNAPSPLQPPSNKALVVVLETLMHIIYVDQGSNYIVHLPFPVLKVWSVSLGLVLERRLRTESSTDSEESELPRLFTLTNPLEDFGMVSCDRGSLDANEEILALSSRDGGLCITKNREENRVTVWHSSPVEQGIQKSKSRLMRRRSSVGPSTFVVDNDDDDLEESVLLSESFEPIERRSSRLSDVSFTMDRTSFADPDRLTDLMGEEHDDIKQEMTLRMVESFSFDLQNLEESNVFLINASPKLDILCLHEPRAKILHHYHFSRRNSGAVFLKEKGRIPALSAWPVLLNKSTRILVLSPDMIARIHAPWHTRLNIVLPSSRLWRSVSPVDLTQFKFTDTKGAIETIHLNLVPLNHFVSRALDVLECLLDVNIYSLFLSVYGIARLKSSADDVSAFTNTLFASFLALDTRSPSPSPHHPTQGDLQLNLDPWQTLTSIVKPDLPSTFKPLSPKLSPRVAEARDVAYHFEGTVRSDHLTLIFLGFHALSEELRLHIGLASHNNTLIPILCQLAHWLGKYDFVEYYMASSIFMDDIQFNKSSISGLRDVAFAKQSPWSIYSWLITCVTSGTAQQSDLLTLDILLQKSGTKPTIEKVSQAQVLLPTINTLRNIYPLLNSNDFRNSFIKSMDEHAVTTTWIENLPLGVALPLRIALSACKREPLSTWSESIYDLIDRKDLVELLQMHSDNRDPKPDRSSHKRIASRAMLGEHPNPTELQDVSTVTEICHHAQSPEKLPENHTVADDHEVITNLIFRNDRRMLEVSKLLEYSEPGVIFWPHPSSPVIDHPGTIQSLALRAMAMPVGKGLLTYNSQTPLSTDQFVVPRFSFVFRMKPQNTMVTVDKTFLTDAVSQWPLFHSGVARALSISPNSPFIDTSWIVFNKPTEPTNQHAGFLLGLGLNGHLKKIARWHILNYLTTKHVLTSVALLLGLGVSYRGTKDVKITKLLSVHVAAMLPFGAADLKINIWIQTAGIMALGLLYCDSRHRRTSEVLLSELTAYANPIAFSYSSSIPPELQRDEGYRLACGLALGFINLGKGPDLRSNDEREMEDRLCRISEGLTLSENAERNMMGAVPGCISALALMYLRTNNKAMAKKLEVPQTAPLMEYVRPDLLFLRTVAKNMVMWDSIKPSSEWISAQFPPHLRPRMNAPAGLDLESLDVLSISSGACYVMGLRFAGTHNENAKKCLMLHLTKLMKVCTMKALQFEEKTSLINLRFFQDALCIALAAVMAGSGDLPVLRILRRLHGRRYDEANYGGHMAAHMAIGLLFMSGGQCSLGTSPLATAALFTASYPKFPSVPSDNHFHLQAFRHLWVLAAEERCFVPRTVDTFQPTLTPIRVTLKLTPDQPTSELELTAPCLLPEFSSIATIETRSNKFQHIILDFTARPSLFAQFCSNPTIFVVRNPITTAFHTPFEQSLAKIITYESESRPKRRSVSTAIQEHLQLDYLEEELGASDGHSPRKSILIVDILQNSLEEVTENETSLDVKCGVVYEMAHPETADNLFDVKLALASFNALRRSGNTQGHDDLLTESLADRTRFRLWTGRRTL